MGKRNNRREAYRHHVRLRLIRLSGLSNQLGQANQRASARAALRSELPHVQSLFDDISEWLDKDTTGKLMCIVLLKIILRHLAFTTRELDLHRLGEAVLGAVPRGEPPEILALQLIAGAYEAEGEYSEARDNLAKALRRCEDFSPNSPDIHDVRSRMARIHLRLGDYPRARNHLENALSQRGSAEEGSRSYLADIDLLATICIDITDHDDAKRWAAKAMEIRKRHGSLGDIDAATTFENLGRLAHESRDNKTALEYYKSGLAIKRGSLDNDDPQIAESLDLIGETMLESDRPERAREILLEALAIKEKTMQIGHPVIARSHHAIGRSYETERLYKEAVRHFLSAAVERRMSLGRANADTARSVICLGFARFYARPPAHAVDEHMDLAAEESEEWAFHDAPYEQIRKGISDLASVLGENDPEVARAEKRLLHRCLRSGKLGLAGELLNERFPSFYLLYRLFISIAIIGIIMAADANLLPPKDESPPGKTVIAFSRDGTHSITVSSDREGWISDQGRPSIGIGGPVQSASFDDEGLSVAIGKGWKEELEIRFTSTGKALDKKFVTSCLGSVEQAKFERARNGNFLWTESAVVWYDLDQGVVLKCLQRSDIKDVKVRTDGKIVMIRSGKGIFTIWHPDALVDEEICYIHTDGFVKVIGMGIDYSMGQVATLGNNQIKIWDASSCELLRTVAYAQPEKDMVRLKFLPNNRLSVEVSVGFSEVVNLAEVNLAPKSAPLPRNKAARSPAVRKRRPRR